MIFKILFTLHLRGYASNTFVHIEYPTDTTPVTFPLTFGDVIITERNSANIPAVIYPLRTLVESIENASLVSKIKFDSRDEIVNIDGNMMSLSMRKQNEYVETFISIDPDFVFNSDSICTFNRYNIDNLSIPYIDALLDSGKLCDLDNSPKNILFDGFYGDMQFQCTGDTTQTIINKPQIFGKEYTFIPNAHFYLNVYECSVLNTLNTVVSIEFLLDELQYLLNFYAPLKHIIIGEISSEYTLTAQNNLANLSSMNTFSPSMILKEDLNNERIKSLCSDDSLDILQSLQTLETRLLQLEYNLKSIIHRGLQNYCVRLLDVNNHAIYIPMFTKSSNLGNITFNQDINTLGWTDNLISTGDQIDDSAPSKIEIPSNDLLSTHVILRFLASLGYYVNVYYEVNNASREVNLNTFKISFDRKSTLYNDVEANNNIFENDNIFNNMQSFSSIESIAIPDEQSTLLYIKIPLPTEHEFMVDNTPYNAPVVVTPEVIYQDALTDSNITKESTLTPYISSNYCDTNILNKRSITGNIGNYQVITEEHCPVKGESILSVTITNDDTIIAKDNVVTIKDNKMLIKVGSYNSTVDIYTNYVPVLDGKINNITALGIIVYNQLFSVYCETIGENLNTFMQNIMNSNNEEISKCSLGNIKIPKIDTNTRRLQEDNNSTSLYDIVWVTEQNGNMKELYLQINNNHQDNSNTISIITVLGTIFVSMCFSII